MIAHNITLAFPHPSLTPSTSRPSYATLTIWQKELSGNTASVSSHLGNGRQGHLALIISEAKCLAITGNVAFVSSSQPSAAARTSSLRHRATDHGGKPYALGVETNIQHLPSR